MVIENVSNYAAAFFGGFVILGVFFELGVLFIEPFNFWGLIAPVAYICYLCAMVHKNDQLAKKMEQEEFG